MEKGQVPPGFVRELRYVLRHLYDPDALRRSPLTALLVAGGKREAPNLQRVLLRAVEDLRPASNVSPQAEGWRFYRILHHRYVQQFEHAQVARTLGLSVRQLYREQNEALQSLAGHLWAQYNLAERACAVEWTRPRAGHAPEPALTTAPSRDQELEWLEKTLPREPIAIGDMIRGVLRTVAPLQSALQVRVELQLPPVPLNLTARRASLRQALLNALTAAIRMVPGGRVTVTVAANACEARIDIAPQWEGPPPKRSDEEYAENLAMARQLAEVSGGTPEPAREGNGFPFCVRFRLQAAQPIILIVDDNDDTLQLFQRYLAASPYAAMGTGDPEQVLAMAADLQPRAIVLDVMLPGTDGWEILERIRADPRTAHIPIIVCTILPEEPLAMALGAAAFLRKPVSQEELLATLGRLHLAGD